MKDITRLEKLAELNNSAKSRLKCYWENYKTAKYWGVSDCVEEADRKIKDLERGILRIRQAFDKELENIKNQNWE